jgi:hypothetical protein
MILVWSRGIEMRIEVKELYVNADIVEHVSGGDINRSLTISYETCARSPYILAVSFFLSFSAIIISVCPTAILINVL